MLCQKMQKYAFLRQLNFLRICELIWRFTETGGSHPHSLVSNVVGACNIFFGYDSIIFYSILYIHSHRSCSHRPGRVASVWWTIWCVVLPCARSSTAGISSIEWIMDKSSEHTAMALNLRVCISNEGRVMPWKFGAKLRNLQLLQYGYRFFLDTRYIYEYMIVPLMWYLPSIPNRQQANVTTNVAENPLEERPSHSHHLSVVAMSVGRCLLKREIHVVTMNTPPRHWVEYVLNVFPLFSADFRI